MRQSVKKAITAGATFSVALGIGFLMQYGDALAARIGIDAPIGGPDVRAASAAADLTRVERPAPALLPTTEEARPTTDMAGPLALPVDAQTPVMVQQLDMSAATFAPLAAIALPDVTADLPVTVSASASPLLTPDDVTTPLPGMDDAVCAPVMTATAEPMAMVNLLLADACRINTPVTIHHQGMMFSAMTDDRGMLNIMVPALARDALFMADFKSGNGIAASVLVPDIDTIDRAVLQWQGNDGVQLHALEFGAGYDGAGHVWSAATNDPLRAMTGEAGFMALLGDLRVSDPLHAEVYTFPSGQSARDGNVILNVEAEVTTGNCGRDVAAQSIQIAPGQPAKAIDLTMMMPPCDAVGEFLVLKNMFADLTLAAR